MVFEIGKPACSLSAASILTVIIYNDVWSFSQGGVPVNATLYCGSGIVYQNRVCYSYTLWFLTAVPKM